MTKFLWVLQILILSAGIYVFLRFVQTTRGSRLVRGLIFTTVLVAVGLLGLTRVLELEHLGHILQSVAGVLVILLVVLFQPELRRGIAQLGERSLVGRLIRRLSRDSINEVVQAVQSMASRRQGALIAIECETSLDPYIEGGVKVDAAVHRLLLESIFYPGATLHDGAVVIRKDRVAAAACLFPLTENIQIARSTGTRHRAALGLADETDAVTIAVSEETGQVSIARHSQIQGVPPSRLEQVLRDVLGTPEKSDHEHDGARSGWTRRWSALWGFVSRDWLWMVASLLLATGVFYYAHLELTQRQPFTLRIVTASPGDAEATAGIGELLVVLPSEDYRVVASEPVRPPSVIATGTRAQVAKIGLRLGGLYEVVDAVEGRVEINLDDVRWRTNVIGVDYAWEGRAPTLEISRFARRRFQLSLGHVAVDDRERNLHYDVQLDEVVIDPPTVEIEGPAERIAELGETLPLTLEPIRLAPGQNRDWRGGVRLAAELRDLGLEIADRGEVEVTVPLVPAERPVGVITREIPLIATRVEYADELERWSIPAHAQTARFSIHVSGLIPAEAEPDSTVVRESANAILRFVEEHLVVYADVAEIPPAGQGRSVRVRHNLREDWRSALGFLSGPVGEREDLRVKLESDEEILLEERPPDPDGTQATDSEGA